MLRGQRHLFLLIASGGIPGVHLIMGLFLNGTCYFTWWGRHSTTIGTDRAAATVSTVGTLRNTTRMLSIASRRGADMLAKTATSVIHRLLASRTHVEPEANRLPIDGGVHPP